MAKQSRTSRDIQAEERRQQILDGAKELFAQHGYHGTSMRTLNRHIGITDGLLYHYFPGGKQEILETVVLESQELRIKKMDEAIRILDMDQPIEEVLYKFIAVLISTLVGDDRTFIRILLKDHESIQTEKKTLFSKRIQERHQVIGDLLRKRAEAGEIRELDYDMAAKQVISLGFMVVLREVAQINIIGEDVDAYIRNMVRFTVSLWKT
ncbi:TetR/AcrR family transcriptional regulator [Gorillibacterium massiliense]|uniref:TetR/AcrR family transcriptional regulator n=1 Tax=Gorillibacterium massiliense TaxID=1280390 RepID=UPI000592C04A|nr:TetR/AcrR family transcriptional regulator [Gorillibacterium massiliense]